MKRCYGCNGMIDTKKERYVQIVDWDGRSIDCESWWHLTCFGKGMNRDLTIMEQQAKKLLEGAQNVYNNIPQELKEEKIEIC